jgi:hypothetical protein
VLAFGDGDEDAELVEGHRSIILNDLYGILRWTE